MRQTRALFWFLSVALVLLVLTAAAWAQSSGPQGEMAAQGTLGTAFTYQGRLMRDGRPVNGTCDLRFRLFDAATGGSQVGPTVTRAGTTITNGLVSVSLDFAANAFTGDARWLEVAVRCPAGSGSYTTLSPRQPITPTPYALFSLAVPWSGITGMPAGFADGVDDDTTYSAGTGLVLVGNEFRLRTSYRLPQGCSNGQVPKWNGTAWTCGDDNTGAGGAYWSLTGNAGTDPVTNFLGTTDNKALELRVNNARGLRIEPGNSPNIIGGYRGNRVTAGVEGATIGGGGASGHTNRVTDNYGTVGGGWGNQAGSAFGTTSDAEFATVGGGRSNVASGYAATIGGGLYNSSGNRATVGGGSSNIASGRNATVGGGSHNAARDDFATVGGGSSNTAGGYAATVGGGQGNTAGNWYATVGGGWENTATGASATVAGGRHNIASGDRASVGGGRSNSASGRAATVPGGSYNEAKGDYSFAAGRRAKANHTGSFVLADATDADFTSSWENQFRARFTGGFTFVVDPNTQYWVRFRKQTSSLIQTSTGAYLSLGGAWTNASDRALKEDFTPVDAREVLERLAHLPLYTWRYKAEDEHVRHMGPTGQDFYAAFGLGADDRHIATVDADGVALAAIQALYARVRELEAENATLRQQLADLEARIAALERNR